MRPLAGADYRSTSSNLAAARQRPLRENALSLLLDRYAAQTCLLPEPFSDLLIEVIAAQAAGFPCTTTRAARSLSISGWA